MKLPEHRPSMRRLTQMFLVIGGALLACVADAQPYPARPVPELPTFAESGLPGFESGTWYGMMAPAGTPREIVNRLNGAIARIAQLLEIRDKLLAQGAEPQSGTPGQMGDFVRSEIAKWGKVAKAAGVRME